MTTPKESYFKMKAECHIGWVKAKDGDEAIEKAYKMLEKPRTIVGMNVTIEESHETK